MGDFPMSVPWGRFLHQGGPSAPLQQLAALGWQWASPGRTGGTTARAVCTSLDTPFSRWEPRGLENPVQGFISSKEKTPFRGLLAARSRARIQT